MNPLERAASLLEQRGWCRHRFYDELGRMCLEFALLQADPSRSDEARECVRAELAERGETTTTVVEWNDHAPDAEAVIDVLRAAADRWYRHSAPEPTPVPVGAGVAPGRRADG